MIEAAILVVFPFAMAHAAISDMLTMTISNRVSLLLVASFALLAPMTGMAWGEYAMHFAALATVLCVCFSLFALGVMGGGDAKLLAATALWFGMSMDLMEYLVLASLLGGMLTISILHYRKSPAADFAGRIEFLHRMANPKEKIPYGIALGTAGLLMFPSTPLAMWVIARLSAM